MASRNFLTENVTFPPPPLLDVLINYIVSNAKLINMTKIKRKFWVFLF